MEVVGRGLDPDEDDLLAAGRGLRSTVGIEDRTTHGRPRRRVQAAGEHDGRRPRGFVELVAQQLLDHRGLDPLERLGPADDPLVGHVGGDPDGGRCGPLGAAGLEHEQPAALDRELEVLHVAVVALEPLGDPLELVVDRGHRVAHLADAARRPDPGHHVLALGVGQELAVEAALAGVRVAREGDARARVLAHVPEHHRHDVDGGAEVVGNVVERAVVAGAAPEPGREDGTDGEVELLPGIAREVASGVLADDPAELARELPQVRGA